MWAAGTSSITGTCPTAAPTGGSRALRTTGLPLPLVLTIQHVQEGASTVTTTLWHSHPAFPQKTCSRVRGRGCSRAYSRGAPCPLGNVPSPPPATAQASSTSSELALITPSKSANPACACISLPYAPPALSARTYQRQPLGRNSPTALSGAAGLGALLATGPTAAGLRLAQHLQEKPDSLLDIAKKAPKADALAAQKPTQHPLGPTGCLFPSLHRAPAVRSAANP